jgi:hypothetical protein
MKLYLSKYLPTDISSMHSSRKATTFHTHKTRLVERRHCTVTLLSEILLNLHQGSTDQQSVIPTVILHVTTFITPKFFV